MLPSRNWHGLVLCCIASAAHHGPVRVAAETWGLGVMFVRIRHAELSPCPSSRAALEAWAAYLGKLVGASRDVAA